MVSGRCLHVSVMKFQDKFASLPQVNSPNSWDKFQKYCTYRHVFHKISTEFRRILCVFVNFTGFHRFTWILRLCNRAKYQKPCPLFPSPDTFVFFCVLLLHGFSRHPQRERLLTDYIHTSYMHSRNFSKWNKSAGNLVEFLKTWPSFVKLRTRVLNVGPRQSAISSLTNLWAAESMRMILNRIDCECTGNWGLLQSS